MLRNIEFHWLIFHTFLNVGQNSRNTSLVERSSDIFILTDEKGKKQTINNNKQVCHQRPELWTREWMKGWSSRISVNEIILRLYWDYNEIIMKTQVNQKRSESLGVEWTVARWTCPPPPPPSRSRDRRYLQKQTPAGLLFTREALKPEPVPPGSQWLLLLRSVVEFHVYEVILWPYNSSWSLTWLNHYNNNIIIITTTIRRMIRTMKIIIMKIKK